MSIKDGKAVLGLFLLVVLVFFRFLFATDILVYNNDITYFYPHETVIRYSLDQGDFPLWNPYFGGGSPGLGKIQIGLLYPTQAVFRYFLPIVPAFNWDAIIHVYLAGLGVYVLLRDLNIRRPASMAGGIVFMFSGAILPRVFAGHFSVLHSIVWIGWLFFAYRRLLLERSLRNMLLTILFACLIILGGHPQMGLIVFFAPAGYFVFIFLPENLRKGYWGESFRGIALTFLVGVLTLGLLAVQLLPFFEWLMHTTRGQGFQSFEFMTRNSFNWEHILTFLMPYFLFDLETKISLAFSGRSLFWEISPFVGVTIIFLMGISAVLVKIPDKRLVRFFVGLMFFGLVMSMGSQNPVYPIIYDKLPFLRAPGRFMLLWVFAITIVASMYLNNFWDILSSPEKKKQLQNSAIFSGMLCVFLLAILVIWEIFEPNLRPMLQNIEALSANQGDLYYATIRRSLIILLPTMLLLTLLLWLGRIENTPIDRWYRWMLAVMIAEMILFAAYIVEPYPVTNLYRSDHPLAELNIKAYDVRINGYREPPNYLLPTLLHVKNGEEFSLLLDLVNEVPQGENLLSAGYLATSNPIDEPEYELVQQTGSSYLYSHIGNVPRIYAANSVLTVGDDEAAKEIVAADSFNALETAVVTLSTAEDFSWGIELPRNDVEIGVSYFGEYINYQNNEISARIITDRPALVVFSELYYPGWQAFVDGVPAEIWKTNYTFRGVLVEDGKHIIEMYYRPFVYQVGLIISIFTLSILIVWSIVWVVRNRCSKWSQDAGWVV